MRLEMREHFQFGTLKGEKYFGEVHISGRIILRYIFKLRI
jgi:hypothetical protein